MEYLPYAPIDIQPLHAPDGFKSSGFSVRLEVTESKDPKERFKEVGVVSNNYLLVPNAQIRDSVNTIADMANNFQWKEGRTFFDSKHFMTSLVSGRLQREVRVGDPVQFGIVGFNSYDQTTSASVAMFVQRLVCSNGMVATHYFPQYRFRHSKENLNWETQVNLAYQNIIGNSEQFFQDFTNLLITLESKPVHVNELKSLRENTFKKMEVGSWGRVIDEYLKAQQWTGMGFLNALTKVYWHSASFNKIIETGSLTNKMIGIS